MMTVKIITDSTSDLPNDVLKELDITVVPLHVLFGKESYRDRVDIDEDEFYPTRGQIGSSEMPYRSDR
jgi:fatty acid-binding protein DegV